MYFKIIEFNEINEFNGETKQQSSGTAIDTKFVRPYACIFMDQVETEFFKTQIQQPLVCFRYINDIFFYLDSWKRKIRIISC